MKKFLLSLCLTMLSVVGVWAQGTVSMRPTPSGTILLDLNDDKEDGVKFVLSSPLFDTQLGNAQVSVLFDGEATSEYVGSSYSYTWGGADPAVLKILPKKVTTAPVKVQIKVKDPTYGSTIEDLSEEFYVAVDDNTLVKSFEVSNQNVQQGKANTIPVLFEPYTAEFQTPTVSANDANVSVAYATNGGKTDYSKLVVTVPNDATLGSTADITLTPKDGSPAEAQTFTVTVVKKELPVNEVMPSSAIHVGQLCENMLGIDDSYGLTKDVDYTVSRVATGTNANGEALVSFDINGDIHGLHAGTATLTFTYTPTETAAASEYQLGAAV